MYLEIFSPRGSPRGHRRHTGTQRRRMQPSPNFACICHGYMARCVHICRPQQDLLMEICLFAAGAGFGVGGGAQGRVPLLLTHASTGRATSPHACTRTRGHVSIVFTPFRHTLVLSKDVSSDEDGLHAVLGRVFLKK